MATPARCPRLLLVEDDPTSLQFLRTALRGLPAIVDTAGTVAEACALAGLRRYDLWLIDAHLPDGRGETLLAQLRHIGAIVPAIAHTAACDTALATHLLAHGFDAVIHKPLSAAQLREAVVRHLPAANRRSATDSRPGVGDLTLEDVDDGATLSRVWDDAAAARALHGSRQHVAALRSLFLAELSAERDAVVHAARTGEGPVLDALLHRLRASCGFVGAQVLERAVRDLQLRQDDADALQAFDAAVAQCLALAPDGVPTTDA